MSDVSDGAPLRADLVDQYCQITGKSREYAERMLEACNNDLDTALLLEFDNEDHPTVPLARPVAPERSTRAAPTPEAAPPTTKSTSTQSAPPALGPSSSIPTLQSSRSKPRTFDDLFAPPVDIMFERDFLAARDVGTQRNLWLLVDVHNDQEFACKVLNRDVWFDERIKTLIRENFVFWQVPVRSEEGERFQNFYPVARWPSYSVIDPRTGEQMVTWDITDPDAVYQALNDFLGDHPRPETLPDSKPAMAEISNGVSKIQLNGQAVMGEGKPKDGFSAPIKGNPVAVKNKAEVQKTGTEPVESSSLTPLQASSDEWKQFLGSLEDPMSEMMIRVPDGRKTVVSMPYSSQIQAVIVYVECLGFSSSKYALMAGYPRRNISELPATTQLKDAGFSLRETVIVKEK